MDRRALVIRHAAVETLGHSFTSVLKEKDIQMEELNLFDLAPRYRGFSAPAINDISLVVILGGPMSVNDNFPALVAEQDLIRAAISTGIPVFGVCLGAQLMSAALGGAVEATGGFQFGLRKIDVTPEGNSDPVFSKIQVPLVPTLHGDCFSIPPGAVSLARGHMLCRDGSFRQINMAYRYKNCYGFQFEPQLTLEELVIWNRDLYSDYALMGDRFDPAEEADRNLREFTTYAPLYEAQMRDMLSAFLENAGLT